MKPWCRCFQDARAGVSLPPSFPLQADCTSPFSHPLGPKGPQKDLLGQQRGQAAHSLEASWSWHRRLQLEGPESTSHPSLWFYRRGLQKALPLAVDVRAWASAQGASSHFWNLV